MAMDRYGHERADLQAIFDAIDVGLLLVGPSGTVRQVNEVVSRWVGRAPGSGLEVAPGDLAGCIHALDAPAGCGTSPACAACPIRRAIETVLATGAPVRGIEAEATVRPGGGRDGSAIRLWLEVGADPVELEGERHVLLTLINITGRKQAEAALRRSDEDLRKSNRDLEQFAHVASHDLQEPLRMVGGFVQLLREHYHDRLDVRADEYIDFAIDGATRMQALIQDLLAYSRIGTGSAAPETVDLAEPLARALAGLTAAREESGATIEIDQMPVVSGDSVQFALVFQNLIANSIKFRSARPPEIRIGARRQGGEWLIWVADNGIGFEPEYAERIFTLFQRLHRREEYPGTGIGLAICRRVIESHGGRIWAESAPGQGATFHFTLPAAGE